jgi:four helix bundle suffix protein
MEPHPNFMVRQANRLLCQQIGQLEAAFVKTAVMRERMTRARLAE